MQILIYKDFLHPILAPLDLIHKNEDFERTPQISKMTIGAYWSVRASGINSPHLKFKNSRFCKKFPVTVDFGYEPNVRINLSIMPKTQYPVIG